jgi:WhiB family redox-sensing transcriptional regulator
MTAPAVGERWWAAPVEPSRNPRAACRGVDTEIFFPGSDESAEPALQVCRSCPIECDCLAWALAKQEKWGVWGGTTERRRRTMLRARARGTRPSTMAPPGEAQALAAGHLRTHPGAAYTPTQMAHVLGRPARTVETSLKRLVAAGRARRIGGRPYRYAAVGTGPITLLPATRPHRGEVVSRVYRYLQDRPGFEFTSRQIAAALPDLRFESISGALGRLATRGELRKLPGRPPRYTLNAAQTDAESRGQQGLARQEAVA